MKYLQEAVDEAILDLRVKNRGQFLDKLDSVKTRLADHIFAYKVAIKLYSEFYFAKHCLNIAIKTHKNIKFIQYRSNWIEDRLVRLLHRRDRAGARVRRRDRHVSSGKIQTTSISNENGKYRSSSPERNVSPNIFMESIMQLLYVNTKIQDSEMGFICDSNIEKNTSTRNQLFSPELSTTIGYSLHNVNQSQLSEMNLTSDISSKSMGNTPSDFGSYSHPNEVPNSLEESCVNIRTPSSQPILGSDFKELYSVYFSDHKIIEEIQQVAPTPTCKLSVTNSTYNNFKLFGILNGILFKNNMDSNFFEKLNRKMDSYRDDSRYFIPSTSLYPKEFDFCNFDSSTSFILNKRPHFQMSFSSKRMYNLPRSTKHLVPGTECHYNDNVYLTTILKNLITTDSGSNLRIEILKLLQTMPNYISPYVYLINELFGSDNNILVRYEAMKILITLSKVNDDVLYFSIKVFSVCNSRVQFDLLRNYRIYLPILNILSSLFLDNLKKCLRTLLHNDLEEISIESVLLLAYYFPSLEYDDFLSSTLLSKKLPQYCLPICVFFVKYLHLTKPVLFFILSRLICDHHETNRIEIAKLICLIQYTDWTLDLRKYCHFILSKLLWEDPSRFVRDQVRQTIIEIGILDSIITENMINLDSTNELIKLRAIKSFGSLREINSFSIARLLEILEIDANPSIKLETIRTLSILSLNEITLRSLIIEKAKGDGYIALEAQKILRYY